MIYQLEDFKVGDRVCVIMAPDETGEIVEIHEEGTVSFAGDKCGRVFKLMPQMIWPSEKTRQPRDYSKIPEKENKRILKERRKQQEDIARIEIGDKIKCIKPSIHTKETTYGNIYVVEKYGPYGSLILDGIAGNWASDRFIKE